MNEELENVDDGMVETRIGATVIRVAKQPVEVVPPAVVRMSPLEFMERFTVAEQTAIVEAAKTNPAVGLFWEKLKMTAAVNLRDVRVIGGAQALEFAGLIAAGRADEILNVDAGNGGGANDA